MAAYTNKNQDTKNDVCYNEHTLWGPGPEAVESETQWNECVKNPGHDRFIPVREFGLHHLPVEWQRPELVEYIKAQSDLTVRLRVMNTSPARPEQGDYSPGPGGQRVGTGYVHYVVPTTGHCPCIDGKGQQQQCQRSWTFYIVTAKHVIYDDIECKATRVDFFHDDVTSREDGTTKTLRGGKVENTRDDRDWCFFSCVCHDEELAEHMKKQVDQMRRLDECLREWWESLSPQPVIIVSHPHGRSKYVTVGEYRDLERDSFMQTYTTPTCPGSSGAGVAGGWMPLWGHHCQGGLDGLNKGWP